MFQSQAVGQCVLKRRERWRRARRKLHVEAARAQFLSLDDEIVCIEEGCIPRFSSGRQSAAVLVDPTIVNNVRTRYHLRQASFVLKDGGTTTKVRYGSLEALQLCFPSSSCPQRGPAFQHLMARSPHRVDVRA
jgi:hypothetical protein